ncbi:MAG: tyrosine-type recombinase/integrase [Alphaproteobacteria bacterium]|nr:tyrosine-type recombinase/integrase [Alphaproteobacteria bacterium]
MDDAVEEGRASRGVIALPPALPARLWPDPGEIPEECQDFAEGLIGALGDIPFDESIARNLAGFIIESRGAFARNTFRALIADLRVFSAWCRTTGVLPLPATPATLARFIDWAATTPRDETGALRMPGTIDRYVFSIDWLHREAGVASPKEDRVVRYALRRMPRRRLVRSRQAPALNWAVIAEISAKLGHRLIDLRDRALLLTARDTGLRASELVELRIEDMTPVSVMGSPAAATILVRRAKRDQEGHGREVALSHEALEAIGAWLEAAAAALAGGATSGSACPLLTEGPLFRSVDRHGRIGAVRLLEAGRETALGTRDVARIFNRLGSSAEAATRGAARFSAHSTRVGAAQDIFLEGADLIGVMHAMGWRDPRTAMRYLERLMAARSPATRRFVSRSRG